MEFLHSVFCSASLNYFAQHPELKPHSTNKNKSRTFWPCAVPNKFPVGIKTNQALFCHALAQISFLWACSNCMAIESEVELLLVVSPATCMHCPNTSSVTNTTVLFTVLFSCSLSLIIFLFISLGSRLLALISRLLHQ